MGSYQYRTITDVAAQVGSGALSPVALTEELLERAESLNPRLHAYRAILRESALRRAQDAEQEIAAGAYRGPLHGVPIALKDNIWLKGVPATNGLAINDEFRPTADATVARKLTAAGAVVLGKLAHTEGAFAEHRPDIPEPVNPWSASHWVGASSSGSGSATAAQLCFASLGTDTGGSIRFPCAMNNLSGMKPTWGRVSRFGVFENSASMDHVGPMARSVSDLAIMLRAMAGSDPADPTASRLPVPDYLAELNRPVRGLRIGLDERYALDGIDDAAARAVHDGIDVLRGLGATTVSITIPRVAQAIEDWLPTSGVEMATAHLDTYPSRAAEYGAALSGLIELGRSESGISYFQRMMRRREYSALFDGLFDSIDAIILPTLARTAPTVAQMAALGEDPDDVTNLVRFTAPNDMSGNPALVLPGPPSDANLPVTFQLVARRFDEGTLFALGHGYQQATDWHLACPDI